MRIALLMLACCQLIADSVEAPKMLGSIESVGSVPPGQTLFRCVSELNGKPYSAPLVHACLKTIRDLPFVLKARVREFHSDSGNIVVTFAIEAPSLKIEDLTFEGASSDEAELKEWLAPMPDALHPGGSFSRLAESLTYGHIRRFYLLRGVLVGVVPKVDLNFKEGIARVNFGIIKGPTQLFESREVPYRPSCKDRIHSVDWHETDDHVPYELVGKLLRLNSVGACYTQDSVKHDREVLDGLGFLKSAVVEYSGNTNHRQVSYSLKGRPLRVQKISIEPYGSPDACPSDFKAHISLKVDDVYSRNAASKSSDELTDQCSPPGFWTEVTEKDEVSSDDLIDVTYRVLTVPLQSVYVDGKRVQ